MHSAASNKDREAEEARTDHIPTTVALGIAGKAQTIVGWEDWVASAAARECDARGCSCDECDVSRGYGSPEGIPEYPAKLGRL